MTEEKIMAKMTELNGPISLDWESGEEPEKYVEIANRLGLPKHEPFAPPALPNGKTLGEIRWDLKLNLLRTRTISPTGVMCSICGRCVDQRHPADMHEVLISRGDVRMGSDYVKFKTHTRENCVLVHGGDCHVEAESADGKYRCAAQLIVFESYPAIHKWLTEMYDMAGNTAQVNNAIRYLSQVASELIGFTFNTNANQWRFV